ncbi:alpha-hydroxy-acid oxidizing protein [uncultured Desulfobacter sp.]|uniref:alpha-hydroxy-acid oxidizing protein n=1 Tax=uncultured Desulfobacter sp. TaxID=240139 RepID=UPI002AAAA664|nr:alpha-hydroxy-acid oxidizing protein [uncultured Desulfobacter sp.]
MPERSREWEALEQGAAFKDNIAALEELHLNMRLIHEVTEPDTGVEILGKKLSLPLFAAPIGGVSFNMGGKISEQEYVKAILQGCKEAGIIGCTGDGVPEFVFKTALEEIKAVQGEGIPFIKPWEGDELFEKIERAKTCGTHIMGMDIDAAGLITLRKMGRPVSPKGVDELGQIIKKSGMKFIVKGIMTVSDARAAVYAGADAIVVSNHGGRVMEYTPGTARVLPQIARAVGQDICVLADGGVRTGGDILKMLALGADAVMIGRPFSVAAMGGLKKGVTTFIETVKSELIQAMVLTGTRRADQVDPSILFKACSSLD